MGNRCQANLHNFPHGDTSQAAANAARVELKMVQLAATQMSAVFHVQIRGSVSANGSSSQVTLMRAVM